MYGVFCCKSLSNKLYNFANKLQRESKQKSNILLTFLNLKIMDCNCPAPTTLTEIIAELCGVNLKQIQRLGFQRRQSGFPFTDATIVDLAEWQTFLTATNDTKIVVTPLIGGDPVIEAGDKITTGGGDNSTLNGVEELEGVNPSNFSAVFKSLSSVTETQIKKLICEKNLVVYLFLQGGNIACVSADPSTATGGRNGFNCESVFLSDRNNAGFGTKDTFNFSFALPAGWSENLIVVKPNFNPLTDL